MLRNLLAVFGFFGVMKNLFPSLLIRRLFLKLSRWSFYSDLRIRGKLYRRPVIGGCSCRHSEPFMVDVIEWLLPRVGPGTFFDVGSNLGQTLLALKSVDPDCKYLGLEPNPFCAYYLKRLITANSLTVCKVIPAALFSDNAVKQLISFSIDDWGDSCASIVQGFRDPPASNALSQQFVVSLNWNSISSSVLNGQVCIVKIDVEGGELDVIQQLFPLLEE